MKSFLKILFLSLGLVAIAGCGDFEWLPSTIAANVAPVANAGSAQSVIIGDSVTLNGSGSSDTNGDKLTYLWALTSQPAGSTAVLTGAATVSPSFIADKIGDYVVSLTVNDGKTSSTNAAATTVSAYGSPPTANAGTDQNVTAGTAVTLDGSASSGANLSYNWSFAAKPANAGNVLLSGTTLVKPTFTPTVTGVYTIQLQVFDRIAGSQTDTVIVTVMPSNTGSLTVTW